MSENRWSLVAVTGVAVFMAQLDGTVVSVALPTIEHDFGAGPSLAEWVVLGYVLPLIALTLPGGRWLDLVGRREALALSVTGFAAASVAVGLAPGIGWMIAARGVQGAFGALLFALVPVITTTAVRPEVRGRAMAIVMTVGPLGGVAGPVLGGLLIESVGWPWIFFLNVPASVLVIAVGWARLPAGTGLRLPGRALAWEAGLLSAAATALMLALSLTAGHGPGWLAVAPVAVPFLLAWRRLPGSRPVRELLRAPGMPGPHLALLAEMAAIMVVLFLLPFHLQRTGAASPAEIGLTMLAFPAGVMVSGLLGGVFADAWGPRPVAIIGTITVTAGLALFIPLADGWSVADVSWRLAVAGLGAGLFAGPNQTMAMAGAPRHLLGTTGATTSLARQVGIALGPALATIPWSMAGYDTVGVRIAIGLATALGGLSVLSLTRRAQAPRARVRQTLPSATEGAEKAGARVRLRKVAELAPDQAINANPDWAAHTGATRHIAESTSDDLLWADAVLMGTPTRYGAMASQLKQFIDTTGPLWQRGLLADKVYSAFGSAGTTHGGHETTLLTLHNVFCHWGGIIVPPGYTDAIQFQLGTPYGSTHVSGQGTPGEEALDGARFQARRVAGVAARLKAGRAEEPS